MAITRVDNFICELEKTQDLLKEKGLKATPKQIVDGVIKLFRATTYGEKKATDISLE